MTETVIFCFYISHDCAQKGVAMTLVLLSVSALALALARAALVVRDRVDCIPKSNDVMVFF